MNSGRLRTMVVCLGGTTLAGVALVIARGDDGRWKPDYSRVLGHFSAAAISNLYYPPSDRGASLVLFNGLAGIGENAVSNLVREFLLKRFARSQRGERPAIGSANPVLLIR